MANPRLTKRKSSHLRTNRGNFAERIGIAAPYLHNKYNFAAINAVYEQIITKIPNQIESLCKYQIKHIHMRNKSIFSGKNKLLRWKKRS